LGSYFARSKLLNSCVPDAVDERAINLPGPGGGAAPDLARRAAAQNCALAVNAATALGCSMGDVSAEDLLDGKVCTGHSCRSPAACIITYCRALLSRVSVLSKWDLGAQEEAVRSCLWRFLRLGALRVSQVLLVPIHMLATSPLWSYPLRKVVPQGLFVRSFVSRPRQGVGVKDVPQAVVLRRPEEGMSAFLDIPPEELLLRWVAHHIAAAGPPWERWLPLRDLGPDLADATALTCLIGRLAPEAAELVNLQCAPFSPFRCYHLACSCSVRVLGHAAVRSWGPATSACMGWEPTPPRILCREPDLVRRAEGVLAAARTLTDEPLPPARGLAEGNARLALPVLAALFRARHGLDEAAAAAAGQLHQFAQWLEEYDVQVLQACFCCFLASSSI
jgi:plastin-1